MFSAFVFKPIRAVFIFTCLTFSVNLVWAQTTVLAPFILTQPDSQTIAYGASSTLSVGVSGSSPLNYQWYKDGTAIAGAMNYYYTISNATGANAGSYTVVIANSAGSVTSDATAVGVSAAIAPAITFQPASRVIPYQTTGVTLYVTASGSGSLSYQWSKDGVALAGATSSSYNLPAATPSVAGNYTVTVTNSIGSATSNAAVVSIGAASAPTIAAQPASQIVAYGYGLGLSVRVNGSQNLSYQWSKNGVAIAGATGTSYNVSAVTTADAGVYTLTATNDQGSATSSAATVTIGPNLAPTITSQPQSQSAAAGNSVYLNVGVAGSPAFTYQWYSSGVALPGQTSNYLDLYSFTAANAGSYTVTVTNSAGSATSNPAVLTLPSGPTAAPAITTQPTSQTIGLGANFSLYCYGSGNTPLTIQWYKDGSAITNATSTSYSISAATSVNAGTYTCVFTNSSGSATSAPAVITVQPAAAPVITLQPFSQTLNIGDYISLSVAASGNPTPSYQWYKDGVAIPNATGYSYGNYSASSIYAGNYYVTATNSAGTATSSTAAVTINAPAAPVIVTQPVSQTLTPDTYSLTLSVGATGSPTLSYQWFKDGTAIVGTNSSSYYLYSLTPSVSGNYTVTVTNGAGSATSSPAAILVSAVTVPTILQQPVSMVVGSNSYMNLSVNASGANDTYQWYKNGVAISGSTSSSISFYSPTAASAGSYTVTVTNSAGSVTSSAAVITFESAPTIATQPANLTVFTGTPATFNVAVSSAVPVSYQWYQNGLRLTDGGNISGSTTATLTLTNNGPAISGSTFSVVATSSAGSITSNAATLTVDETGIAHFTSTPSPYQTVAAGTNVSFTVAGAGTPAPIYQWYYNNAPIAGATTTTYSLTSVSAASSGNYTVTAVNAGGSSSFAVTLVVAQAPSFTLQPQNQTANLGSSVSFSGAATGSPTPTYQWYFNGAVLVGATSPTFTIASVQSSNLGNYNVVASNAGGSVTSNTATLATGPTLSFTQQPQGAAVSLGAPMILFSTAVGTPAPTYQWYFNNRAIGGATSAFYSVNTTQVANSGSYTVTAANSSGAITSIPAMVLVSAPSGAPAISSQPASQVVASGSTVVFSVTPAGTASASSVGSNGKPHADAAAGLTYQWYFNGFPLGGATDSTLVIQANGSTAGAYTCLITSASGAILSNVAGLSVVGSPGNPGRLINLSVLGIDSPSSQLIVGFTSGGSNTNPGELLLLRLTGPALANFSVPGAIADPTLTLFDSLSTPVAANSGWGSSAGNRDGVTNISAAVGAFPLSDPSSADSALLITLLAGRYTVVAGSTSGGTGQALAEVYDGAPQNYSAGTSARLLNLSCRQQIPASGVLTAGFTIGGVTAKTVLIRVTGPALAAFGVQGIMPDPVLKIFSGQTMMGANAGWAGKAAITAMDASVGAFALSDATSADSAVVLTLPPGPYTVQATSASGTAGSALIELYEVP